MESFPIGQLEVIILTGAVVAMVARRFKIPYTVEVNVSGRLRLLVEAESLFNDGTAAVLFALALLYASGRQPSVPGAVWMLLVSIIGGVLCGLAVGGAAYFIIGRTEDDLVELSMT